MTEQERHKIRESIARLINHGLNDTEIYSAIEVNDRLIYPVDLIGIIRDLMTERQKNI